MSTEISRPALTAQPERLPPELMLGVIKAISEYNWPEMWFCMRLLSQCWKYEVERLFRGRYLPKMTISVRHPSGRNEYDFQYDSKESSCEHAVFSLTDEGIINVRSGPCHGQRSRWRPIVSCLEQSGGPGDRSLYMIELLELYVINNTELVGLQDDRKTHSISFEWIPTVSLLFKQEMKIRQLTRVNAERRAVGPCYVGDTFSRMSATKGFIFYMLSKHTTIQRSLVIRARSWPNPEGRRITEEDEKLFSVVQARTRLRLPKDCLYW